MFEFKKDEKHRYPDGYMYPLKTTVEFVSGDEGTVLFVPVNYTGFF
ncbi:hypothetical protein [Pseudoalteromonas rubra]|nr:hypothetical protein [Pseudoalteromonas rubra]